MKTLTQKFKIRPNRNIELSDILRKISFSDLEIFSSVARLESVSGAARELKLLPPHISKSIKRIENAVGTQLLNRSRVGVTLTPEGQKFTEFVQELSVLVSNSTWDHPGPSSTPLKTELLTLAGSSFLMTHVAAPVVTKLKRSTQIYRFRFAEMGESPLFSLAMKEECEAILHFGKHKLPKAWNTVAVAPITWILCGRFNHPLGKLAKEIDALKYPFVLPVYSSESGFRFGEDKCPVSPRKRIRGEEAQTAETGLQVVYGSNQLIFVPEIMVREKIAQNKLQEIQIRTWAPVREELSISINADKVNYRLFEELLGVLKSYLSSV